MREIDVLHLKATTLKECIARIEDSIRLIDNKYTEKQYDAILANKEKFIRSKIIELAEVEEKMHGKKQGALK